MKKIYLILLSVVIITSCEDDDSPILLQLNDFESTVIPFLESQTVEFTNELSEIITSNVTARDINTSFAQISNGPVYELERAKNDFTFETRNEKFTIQLNKTIDNLTKFSIFISKMDEYAVILQSQCDQSTELIEIESQLTDVTINGFDYNNVFRLKLCDYVMPNDEINFVQIIYSVENGIEYIEYDDGTYLRQITNN